MVTEVFRPEADLTLLWRMRSKVIAATWKMYADRRDIPVFYEIHVAETNGRNRIFDRKLH